MKGQNVLEMGFMLVLGIVMFMTVPSAINLVSDPVRDFMASEMNREISSERSAGEAGTPQLSVITQNTTLYSNPPYVNLTLANWGGDRVYNRTMVWLYIYSNETGELLAKSDGATVTTTLPSCSGKCMETVWKKSNEILVMNVSYDNSDGNVKNGSKYIVEFFIKYFDWAGRETVDIEYRYMEAK